MSGVLADPLPNPKILSLLLTLQCTAECMHCGTLSGPKVKGRLSPDRARRLIVEAKDLAFDIVVFTGGDATLYGNELFDLIALASSFSLPTRLVTNAHWAKTTEKSAWMIGRLKDAGLREINYSTGDQHVRFVPIRNIALGLRAALDADFPVAVMIEVVAGNTITRESLCAMSEMKALFTEHELSLIEFSESPWMPLDADDLSSYPEGVATNARNLHRRLGCDSVINTTTVLADGKMMACCGLGIRTIPELEIGHVDLDTIASARRSANDDFLKRWIRYEGPERILQWASGKDASIVWEDQYAHRCQACKRLYTDPAVRNIVENSYEEKVLDVMYGEWLLYNKQQARTALSD